MSKRGQPSASHQACMQSLQKSTLKVDVHVQLVPVISLHEDFLDYSLLQVFRAPFVEAKDLFTHEVSDMRLIFRLHSINPFSCMFAKA